MKYEINEEEKTIIVKDNCNMGELFKTLKHRFKKGEWKEYTFKTEDVQLYPIQPIQTYPIYYDTTPINVPCREEDYNQNFPYPITTKFYIS